MGIQLHGQIGRKGGCNVARIWDNGENRMETISKRENR